MQLRGAMSTGSSSMMNHRSSARSSSSSAAAVAARRRGGRRVVQQVRASALAEQPQQEQVVPPAAAAPQSPLLKDIQFLNPMWQGVESEQQFFALLKGYLSKVPGGIEKLLPQWQDFYNNYRNALTTSGVEGANELLAAKVQSTIADTVTLQFMQPYTFPSKHERMLAPYNYFEFGQRYVATLINFDKSLLGHRDRWDQISSYLAQGHNVVLLANHQTEADPGVFAHMLLASHPNLAQNVIYVAGDRVVTDPLCKPFSMGRNLFCVHSKKHLDDVPELKAAKMETNRKTLVAMQRSLNAGGCLIWIAPSGGRDRPKGTPAHTSPDPFDPSAVELMRSLASRAKQPGHLFPMAMFSHPIMPPPVTVDKAIGERRITNFSPVGISVCQELDVAKVLQGAPADDKEAQQRVLAKAAEDAVIQEYAALEKALFDPAARTAAYTQPWKQH